MGIGDKVIMPTGETGEIIDYKIRDGMIRFKVESPNGITNVMVSCWYDPDELVLEDGTGHEIDVGDVVALRGISSPDMLVLNRVKGEDDVRVGWFNEMDEMNTAYFKSCLLVRAQADKD